MAEWFMPNENENWLDMLLPYIGPLGTGMEGWWNYLTQNKAANLAGQPIDPWSMSMFQSLATTRPDSALYRKEMADALAASKEQAWRKYIGNAGAQGRHDSASVPLGFFSEVSGPMDLEAYKAAEAMAQAEANRRAGVVDKRVYPSVVQRAQALDPLNRRGNPVSPFGQALGTVLQARQARDWMKLYRDIWGKERPNSTVQQSTGAAASRPAGYPSTSAGPDEYSAGGYGQEYSPYGGDYGQPGGSWGEPMGFGEDYGMDYGSWGEMPEFGGDYGMDFGSWGEPMDFGGMGDYFDADLGW